MRTNKYLIEPFGDLVDHALLYMRTNIAHNDAFSGQENDQVQQELLDIVSDLAFEDPADDAIVIDNKYAISNNSNSMFMMMI